MGFLFSFLAILGESAGNTIDKLNFRKNRITYRQSLLLVFFGMTVLLSGFILITKQPIPDFTTKAIGLLSLIVLFSFAANILDTISLKTDDLSLREPMVDFQPILAGLVGYALFPSERETSFLVGFVVGAIIVYWGTHRRILGRVQKKGMKYLLLASLLYAFLPSIYQVTLPYIPPAYISVLRCAAILVLLAIFLPVRRISKLSTSKVKYSFSAALFYAGEAIANLYAIERLGVVLTMLILMLGPTMRYWASSFILKEKVRLGEMAASFLLVVVVVLVAVSQ